MIEGSKARRLPTLDGLRFIAAALIVLHHAGFASGATFTTRAGPVLARLDVGVAIFFVLSGFLLYRPMVARQLAGDPAVTLTDFYGKRVARIYPAYWAALWITLVVGGTVVGDLRGFIHTSLLTHVYIPARGLSGLPQSWSLAAEIAFYLALPALAGLGWRLSRSVPAHRRPQRLIIFTSGLYLSSLAFRLLADRLAPDRFEAVVPLWMPAQLDHFALGMALAVVATWGTGRVELRRWIEVVFRSAGRWWLFALGVLWFTSTQLDLARGLDRSGLGSELLRQGLYGVIALAMVAPLALCPHGGGALRRILEHPLARWLGRVSYGLYLWHLWLIVRLPGWRGFAPFDGHFWELALVGLVGGTALAGISHRALEDPVNRLVRRRLMRTNPLGTTQVPA